MARAEWTLTAEDELTEPAYWIAVEDERPLTARRVVEELQHKAEIYADTPRIGPSWLSVAPVQRRHHHAALSCRGAELRNSAYRDVSNRPVKTGCAPVSKPMPDKRGQIPAELSPILRRRLSRKTWIKTVLNIGRWLRLAAGPVASLAAEAARRDRRRLQGVSHSRAAFA